MKYEDVKSPEELLLFMSENISYGVATDDGKVYSGADGDLFQEACRTKWKLCSPERVIKTGYGHCFDDTELERAWFVKNGYECKTLFIWFCMDHENPYFMHTYLVYKDENKWKYFEYSDSDNRGIYTFDSYDDAISFQRNKFIDYNSKMNPVGEDELKCLEIYEYDRPKYGINNEEFITYIMKCGRKL